MTNIVCLLALNSTLTIRFPLYIRKSTEISLSFTRIILYLQGVLPWKSYLAFVTFPRLIFQLTAIFGQFKFTYRGHSNSSLSPSSWPIFAKATLSLLAPIQKKPTKVNYVTVSYIKLVIWVRHPLSSSNVSITNRIKLYLSLNIWKNNFSALWNLRT